MTAGGHNDGWRGRWPGRVLRFPVTRIVLGFLDIIVVATTTAGCNTNSVPERERQPRTAGMALG